MSQVEKINSTKIDELMKEYGDAFYILDSKQFKQNFSELKEAFSAIYPNFNIAYSYKTNYTPELCRIVNELGGFAEVVSDMEMEIALRVGVSPSNIIWNGPYKNSKKVEELLLRGGVVNLDNAVDTEYLKKISAKYPNNRLRVGIRCNFDIGDGVISRFGYDIESKDFAEALALVNEKDNVVLNGLQCHFATRSLDTWRPRAEKMIALLDKYGLCPDYVDLGGGLFGKMHDSLKVQFNTKIPTYEEYATEVAPLFRERYGKEKKRPTLLIEPGSALVGDCMRFASRVECIKTVNKKPIATLLGSIYNINPTLNKKNPPLQVLPVGLGERKKYENLDFGGFTCIESDYLYRGYSGELAVGDIVVFGNVGSYSVVLKPPFILPNFPILEIAERECKVVKRAENFDDLFHTFSF
ncbi:MAG: pyridoxal-dependent decarboxylase [Clostridia bacterium]|nr:pyridoxal-dependent decarboxylase [Clostridia bacterium]